MRHMSCSWWAVDDRADQEQERFEERVRHDVEEARRVGPDADARTCRAGSPSVRSTFLIVLTQRDRRGEDRRAPVVATTPIATGDIENGS